MSAPFKKLLFLGPPGVGKGTYARKIAPLLGFVHVSAGDLLRQQTHPDIVRAISQGDLVPEGQIFNIIRNHLRGVQSRYNGVLLDGFPRNAEQAERWMVSEESIHTSDLAVCFGMRNDVLVGKLAHRKICSQCGDSYNSFGFVDDGYDLPPINPARTGICDSCGGALIARSDDSPDTVRKRLSHHQVEEERLLKTLENVLGRERILKVEMKRGLGDMDQLLRVIRSSLD
jgi:adenylate kinase